MITWRIFNYFFCLINQKLTDFLVFILSLLLWKKCLQVTAFSKIQNLKLYMLFSSLDITCYSIKITQKCSCISSSDSCLILILVILWLLLFVSIKLFDKSTLDQLATIFTKNSVNFLSYYLKVTCNRFNKFVLTLNIKKNIRFNFRFIPLCTVWRKIMKVLMIIRVRMLSCCL